MTPTTSDLAIGPLDPSSAASRTGDGPHGGEVTELVESMAAAWRRGERPLAEEFLARAPEIRDEEAIRIVYEEICLRQEAGDSSASAEVLKRFPHWRSRLSLLLDGNWMMRTSEASFAEVGEDLGDFRILSEIGRGAVGRTYLASQRSLADRPVVLKVTALGHQEHLSLARLQHMHIVPLYFEQVVPDRNLRLLCMPNLGGTTLARILKALHELPAEQRTGRHILEALDRCGIALPMDEPPGGPFRKYLAQASYIQALCWLGACLADALQYAHDRGLVHMDVKPSNVLVAADGQPMLLDFHLARGPVGPDRSAPERLGGTPHFMAPEQREAMAAVRQGRALTISVDGRADIFALGLMLYEALGGDVAIGQPASASRRFNDSSTRTWKGSEVASSRRPLNRCNPKVSPGLSDILRKCLANSPADRYRDASSLAIDLRRHLNDLPLRGVPNRSVIERWRKWRRRRPAALARGVLLAAAFASVLPVLGITLAQARKRTLQIEESLSEGRDHLQNRRYPEATSALKRGLDLAKRLPDLDWRKQAIRAELRRILSAKTALELDGLVDLLRFRSGIHPPSSDEARSFFRRGQEIWKLRGLLTRPSAGPLDGGTERQVRTNLLDLAVICADFRVHWRSREGGDEALRDALQLLRDAEAEFGPSPALRRDLRNYAKALGRADLASLAIPIPRTAWEHYDLGRSYLRSGEHALAIGEFQQAVALQPGEFWPHFFEGVCAYRLGRYPDAVASLNICVALAPRTAECFYNRGVANEALGRSPQALSDYSRALALSPAFADAALNRGILAYRQGRYAEATHDLELARGAAPSGRAHGLIEYNLALVHLARKDVDAAKDCLRRAIQDGDPDARDLFDRLRLK